MLSLHLILPHKSNNYDRDFQKNNHLDIKKIRKV